MPPCPVPGRWVLDELAGRVAVEAAESEVVAALARWEAIEAVDPGGRTGDAAMDRYLLAVSERDALRAGRP